MNKYLLILPIAFFAIGGCSSGDDAATQETSGETIVSTEKMAPKKISDDNPFSTQINALDTAKMVGAAAQKSVDDNQQKMQQATDHSMP